MKINLSECRYCSEVSLAQREDPIGTAGIADKWLIIEVPRPWKKQIWTKKPKYKAIIELSIELEQQQPNSSLRLMAIASDKEYSVDGKVRVFYYFRQQKMFANYEKIEYLIEKDKLIELVGAIVLEPKKLTYFDNNRQDSSHVREILVCTHTQYDTACGRYGTPLYQKLRKHYADNNLRIWHTSHFGGHKFAPTLIDFPSGRFWGHLESELLDSLIYQQRDLESLKYCYRGWSGLSKFAQIAEREVLLKEGWQWFDYLKSGKIVRCDRGNLFQRILRLILQVLPLQKAKLLKKKLEQDCNWAEVLIEYTKPYSDLKQAYKVKVEVKTNVMTAAKTSKQMQLRSVKQYTVSQIEKIKVDNISGLETVGNE